MANAFNRHHDEVASCRGGDETPRGVTEALPGGSCGTDPGSYPAALVGLAIATHDGMASIRYNANYNNPYDDKQSADHPHGVGVGYVESAPGREMVRGERIGGRDHFREYVPGGVGRREVRNHVAEATGQFSMAIGTNGDRLSLRINRNGGRSCANTRGRTSDGDKPRGDPA
jgi:hypothetical protein